MARYGTDYRNQLPCPSRYTGFGAAGTDGLFSQFEPFDLETFRSRANWPRLAGLGILLSLVIFLLLVISTTAANPAG
jgi:hypothetical protein